MTLFLKSVLVFVICFKGFGQDNTTLPNSNVLDKDIIVNDSIPAFVTSDSIYIEGIKSSHWDTKRYNPFKEEIIKYPIQITFEDSTYRSPVLNNEMVITSRYGWRNRRAHKGIDIDLISGDDVVSIMDGVVRFARYNSGHGRTVVVRHFNGLESTYAHLSSYAVKANDTVRKGQVLGRGGISGNARGSHLHLVISYKGIAINPEYLFNFKTQAIRAPEIWVTRRWTTPFLHNSRRQTKLELLQTEDQAIASLDRETKVYIVKRGDTLSRISSRNNISIRSICVANNIKRTSVLKVGQKLILEL